ncbi:putative 3-phenylpropionic acid transporter [uncultured Flavonifractor sp.]|nr:putative 3-phenylpropionic acid transporter [uncultured Flavonifractor sp.]
MNAAQPSLRRLDLHYIVMQMGYWAMFAAICAYLAALLGERGFSNSQIGLLIAIRCLAGIIFQPLLGGFADRHPEIPLKVIVSLSLALSLAASLAFLLWPMGMGGTAVILIILGGFEISAYPLMDAMAIQFINAGMPIRYSLGRGIGSMAYAVTCVILGLQTQAMGVESTLITHAVLVAAVIALTITYPTFRSATAAADAPPAEKPHSVWYLLRNNPPFTLMLVAILLGLTACLPMSNFLVNVVESRGGNSADLGVALFIMGGFELPTAFFFQRMLRRLGSGKLILISMVFTVLKAVALLLSFNLATVFLAQPLQMLGYGLFTPASVYFVNESVPEADRVRGQTVMMVASNGMGGMLGSYISGLALDAGASLPMGGANLMLLCCIALGCAATALAAAALAWSRMTNK